MLEHVPADGDKRSGEVVSTVEVHNALGGRKEPMVNSQKKGTGAANDLRIDRVAAGANKR